MNFGLSKLFSTHRGILTKFHDLRKGSAENILLRDTSKSMELHNPATTHNDTN